MKEKSIRSEIKFLTGRQAALAKEGMLTTNVDVATYCHQRVNDIERELRQLRQELEQTIKNKNHETIN